MDAEQTEPMEQMEQMEQEDRGEPQYMKARDAMVEMGINRVKLAELLRRGDLPYEIDPLDMRVKLIPVSAIEAYKRERAAMRRRVTNPKARAARVNSAA